MKMVIGGAWLKDKDGKKFYSCQIQFPLFGTLNFAIFKNDKKEEGSNQPDYHIVWSPPKKSNDQPNGAASTGADNPFNSDDIPF
jgi:uncharacterized protein (DUF736 family)